ncbi:hypothetical protein [Scytonema sp. NUACC26]|uniref:hypothetical protein n=1 Tax=Scytonema sp. NUACC26 TaxID=3140176 RepID=UPI0034DB9C8B
MLTSKREHWGYIMKDKSLKIRISSRRLNKLQLYAAQADKTMTQVMEELIDSLPQPQQIGNQVSQRVAGVPPVEATGEPVRVAIPTHSWTDGQHR